MVALAGVPESANRVAVVHRGSKRRTRGGGVFVYPLPSDARGCDAPIAATGYRLWPDARSRLEEPWEREQGRLARKPSGEAVSSAVFADGGRLLVTGGQEGSVRLWWIDAALRLDSVVKEDAWSGHPTLKVYVGARLRNLRGMTAEIADVAVSTDGSRVAAVDVSGVLRFWDIDGREIATHATPWAVVQHGHVYALGLRSEASLITTHNRGVAQLWRVRTEDGLGTQKIDDAVWTFKRGKGQAARHVSILDAELHGSMSYLAVALRDHTVRLLSLDKSGSTPLILQDTTAWKFSHKTTPYAVAFAPSNPGLGARFDLASGDRKGTVILWDIGLDASGDPVNGDAAFGLSLTEAGRPAVVNALVFHPGGRWLVAATDGGELHVIALEDPACGVDAAIRPACVVLSARPDAFPIAFGFHGMAIKAVAFDAAGERFALGGTDGTALWWALEDGSWRGLNGPGRRLPGTSSVVQDITFLPNDGGLAAVGGDSHMRI